MLSLLLVLAALNVLVSDVLPLALVSWLALVRQVWLSVRLKTYASVVGVPDLVHGGVETAVGIG